MNRFRSKFALTGTLGIMLFNSFEFLVFFPVVVLLYYIIPWKMRWMMLLTASYWFYASWNPKYLLLIIVTTLTTYYTGLQMSKVKDKDSRKPWLWLSLAVNLGLLFFFKYFNFANETLETILGWMSVDYTASPLKVLLPVGISFYTFQSLSYSIDIYYGRTKVEKHLGIYALYVSYFPQLVMGPIERSNNLLPQLKREQFFDYDRIVHGMNKIAYGFFKKLVVADRLKLYVDEVHITHTEVDGIAALISAYFFAFQMYCDFSGYSDIAIGCSRIMGVELMENFKKPFLSKNISDFWVRWHVSLTTWFMDYVFVPLGGYSPKLGKTAVNLMIVAMVTGLWHGANWTFVIAFGIMGLMMVARVVWIMKLKAMVKSMGIKRLPDVPSWVNILFIFNSFVICCFYIRSENVEIANTLISKVFAFDYIFTTQNLVLKNGQFEFMLCILALILLFLSYLMPFSLRFGKHNITYLIFMTMIIYFLGNDISAEFFYFQF